MTKHTPGPWKWDEPSNWCGLSTRVYHEDAGRCEPIAQVNMAGWPKRTARANSALIAAAPELLEALRRALTAWDTDIPVEWESLARAAITKAEGSADA